MINVRNGGQVSDTFDATNSVKQEYVLALTLSPNVLSVMLEEVLETWGTESTSNHARMQTSSQLHTSERRQKTTHILVRELVFADNTSLISHSVEEIQRSVDAFATASSKYGLKSNIKRQKCSPNRTLQQPGRRALMQTVPY